MAILARKAKAALHVLVAGFVLASAGAALADARSCSDDASKQALIKKTEAQRAKSVKMLNRFGREAWAKVTGVHEIETLSKDKESGRIKCFAKVSVESNYDMMAVSDWLVYTLGKYDDGTPYTDVRILTMEERQKFRHN